MKNFNHSIPQLVSYPRTGSHWVRLILENYLNKYCLPTSFLNSKDWWGYHLHDRVVGRGDEGITSDYDKVIYLYRNPIDTIFSQLMYEKLDVFSDENIQGIANEYHTHLKRWLYNNNDCKEIIFITYENMKENPCEEIKKVLFFLNYDYDEIKLKKIIDTMTLGHSKKFIMDNQVINNGHFNGQYQTIKEKFVKNYSSIIEEKFKDVWKQQ